MLSHPLRGEWIETPLTTMKTLQTSHPLRGEWIEITNGGIKLYEMRMSRSAWSEWLVTSKQLQLMKGERYGIRHASVCDIQDHS